MIKVFDDIKKNSMSVDLPKLSNLTQRSKPSKPFFDDEDSFDSLKRDQNQKSYRERFQSIK